MKPHQVRSHRNGAAKSKQVQKRSTPVESQRENPNSGARFPDSYRILTDRCLETLPPYGPKRRELLQALYAMMTPAHPDRAVVMDHLKAMHGSAGVARELVCVAHELESARDEAEMLAHFVASDLERQKFLQDKGIVGTQASEAAATGFLIAS